MITPNLQINNIAALQWTSLSVTSCPDEVTCEFRNTPVEVVSLVSNFFLLLQSPDFDVLIIMV